MYSIFATSQFKKDLKKAKRSGLNIAELQIVVDCLAKGEELDTKYKDHVLGDRKTSDDAVPAGHHDGCNELRY